MPWEESRKMDEKLRFVSRCLDGGTISALCREVGIFRVIGHKIINRYQENGVEARGEARATPVAANRVGGMARPDAASGFRWSECGRSPGRPGFPGRRRPPTRHVFFRSPAPARRKP